MNPEDFRTVQRQAAIWTEDFDPGTRPVMTLATSVWSDLFDGDPVVMPYAPGLPVEVPRITIRSGDQQWRLQVGVRRVDIFWESEEEGEVPDDGQFTNAVLETLQPYLELDDRIRVIRMAYVVQRHARADSPAHEMALHFCRDAILEGPLNRPETFELHAHKRYVPEGLPEVNSWIRWKTASAAKDNTPMVSVLQDLNTPGGVTDHVYAFDEVGHFFRLVPTETDQILRLYLET